MHKLVHFMSDLNLPITINEIFYSIQGESSLAGHPTIFVRTTGCNIRCTYCDTKYSYFEGTRQTLGQVVDKIKTYPSKIVCVTGGEPMAQPHIIAFLNLLVDENFQVSLETNGHYNVSPVHEQIKRIIDVKTPGSGEGTSFNPKNLEGVRKSDEFKFVICSQEDYVWAKDFVSKNRLSEQCTVFFSPAFDEMPVKLLAEKILEDSLSVRLQLQLHKYIWNPQARGV